MGVYEGKGVWGKVKDEAQELGARSRDGVAQEAEAE